VVTDPTTGADVEIEDVTGEFEQGANEEQKLTVPNTSLPEKERGVGDIPLIKELGVMLTRVKQIRSHDFAQPTQEHKEYSEKQDVTAPPEPTKPHTTTDIPIRGEKTNILLHPTPSLSLEDTVFASFEQKAGGLCIGIFATIVVLGKVLGGSSIFLSGFIGLLVAGGVWYWAQGVMQEAKTVDWESEKKRGQTAINNLLPESVEWMNNLMGIVWGLVNPDMLSGVADMLEDVLQASSPSIIQNIR
jgi:Ca2+-dependent lipid-binding protein